MAPIKFEENIKEKLEKRTLPPSENAWHRLEEQLNTDAKKQNKNKFWWFGVAAGFIGLLFVVQQFINQDNTNSVVSPIVVISDNEVITNPVKSSETTMESQEVIEKRVAPSENKKRNTIPTSKHVVVNTVKKTTPKQKINQPLAASTIIITKEEKASKGLKTNLIVKDEMIASVVKTEGVLGNKENQVVSTSLETSESEIEALLAAATKNMQLKGNKTVNTVSVDANALLEDVETEMPPSLRGQLFKVIEKNFKTATTAVTTRNE